MTRRSTPTPRQGLSPPHVEAHVPDERLASPSSPPDVETLDDQALLVRLLERSHAEPIALAAHWLDRFGDLGSVVSADPGELARAGDAAPAVLADLKLCRALAVRLARIEAERRPVLASWSALVAYVRAAMAHRSREQFRVLYLDNRNRLIRDEGLAEGTVNHAPVYPREVVRRALELSASALILVHNHPSGDPAPSRADIEMTRKIVQAADLLELKVHDHLVIAREGTASFRSLGLM